MQYINTLIDQLDSNEITFPKACDFLEEHGIGFLAAMRMLNEARFRKDTERALAIMKGNHHG
jgi:hypothetical protein